MKILVEVEVPDGTECGSCDYLYFNEYEDSFNCGLFFYYEIENIKCTKCLEAIKKSNSSDSTIRTTKNL